VEHFNYTPRAEDFYLEIVASRSIKGHCPPCEWLRQVQIWNNMPYRRAHATDGKGW